MNPSLQKHICKNCGNEFVGFYCNQCGEKVILPEDRSFRTFLNSILLAVTLADSRFIKTIWLMIKRPGELSKEFAEGRRIKYLRPLSVFFVLNLVYFLFPVIQLFNASLRTQINSFHGSLAVQTVATKMTKLGYHDVASFGIVYDQKTAGLAKMLVIVFAVIVSLPLNLIYRSGNRYFTDHVGLSVELVCFNLLINALFLTLIVNVFGLGKQLDETVLTAIFITTNFYFLIRSGRIFYNEKIISLIIKSVVMIAILKISLEIYRAILFYVTINVM
ncbi:MAG: DUF3667 domain-containing protein [Cyclobacteriaceae bacterium]|nr:DUF3667 domain-containing protein [Cyclobacteriaceae bacterium]